jgi:hypothetical protein
MKGGKNMMKGRRYKVSTTEKKERKTEMKPK